VRLVEAADFLHLDIPLARLMSHGFAPAPEITDVGMEALLVATAHPNDSMDVLMTFVRCRANAYSWCENSCASIARAAPTKAS
jgi:hypothetical protein